jgi:NitT/TauT family transport system substrate-binding protein
VRAFFDKMVKAGLYKPGEIDPDQAVFDLFVNRGTGREIGHPPAK